MASEVFVSAMMLITAVVAGTILIMAVFPVVWTMVGTFSSASHESDVRMRTDIKIVSSYASSSGDVKILMKNIGTVPIGTTEIDKSTVVIGAVGDFSVAPYKVLSFTDSRCSGTNDCWVSIPYKTNTDSNYWSPGETLEIDTYSSKIPTGTGVYFEFILPSGVGRSLIFTISSGT